MSKTTSQKTTPIAVEEMDGAQLKAAIDQAEARSVELQDRMNEIDRDTLRPIREEIHNLNGELAHMRRQLAQVSLPFKRGDIVEDDQGVRYRVHEVYQRDEWVGGRREIAKAGQVFGIRLTKTGVEAYSRPREIVSSKPLVKVQV